MSDVTDQQRLDFVSIKACELTDLTLSEAKLVDDISMNGERELQRHERAMIDNMMARHREMKKRG